MEMILYNKNLPKELINMVFSYIVDKKTIEYQMEKKLNRKKNKQQEYDRLYSCVFEEYTKYNNSYKKIKEDIRLIDINIRRYDDMLYHMMDKKLERIFLKIKIGGKEYITEYKLVDSLIKYQQIKYDKEKLEKDMKNCMTKRDKIFNMMYPSNIRRSIAIFWCGYGNTGLLRTISYNIKTYLSEQELYDMTR